MGNNRVVANASGTSIQSNQYYPFGMAFAEGTKDEQGKQPYKYNSKELDKEHDLNWYDYSARYFSPDVPRFTTPDPHSENYYAWSPYVYCGNNPMRLTDPTGMDWVSRVVNGITEIYYDRDVRSQNDINIKYGSDGGVSHISSGKSYSSYDKEGNVLAQFNFFNDPGEHNEYGIVTDANGNLYADDQIMEGNNFTIFGTSNKSTNAETLHKNYLWGPSYLGSNNPKDYNGDDSYQYKSRLLGDLFPTIHDKDYDKEKATGPMDAIFNTNVLIPDLKLVAGSSAIALSPCVSLSERARAGAVVIGFGAISAFKLGYYPVLQPINAMFNRKK